MHCVMNLLPFLKNSLNKKVENIVVLFLNIIIMYCTPLLSITSLNMGRPKLNKTKQEANQEYLKRYRSKNEEKHEKCNRERKECAS